MRNVTWIRFGIAATIATVGAAGMLAVGCSDDDNVGTTPGVDSGTPDTGPKADTGVVDANKPDSQPLPPKDAGSNAKLILVHSAQDVPAIRVCFGTGKLEDGTDSVVQPLPSLPNTLSVGPNGAPQTRPGLEPGTGGAFPDITDLSATAITPFVILADAIPTEIAPNDATCDQLVGTTKKACTGAKCLAPNTGKFIQLPTIKAQTFLKEKTFLLSAIGCVPASLHPDAGNTPEKCGASYGDGGTGNVAVEISELDTTFTPPAGGIGAQFVHRASAIEGFSYPTSPATADQLAKNGFVPGFIVSTTAVPDAGASDAGDAGDGGDAGPPAPVTTTTVLPLAPPTKFGNNPPTPAVGNVIPTSSTSFAVFLPSPDGGTPVPAPIPAGNILLPPLTLGQVQQFTTGMKPPPSMFQPGETYTFVLMGDPAAQPPGFPDGGPNPNYNGHGYHVVAFPNHPVVKGL